MAKDYVAQIHVWAEIEGMPFDINSFSMSYALNAIPVAANISMSPGSNSRLERSAFSLEDLQKSITDKVQVRIKMGVTPIHPGNKSSPHSLWPSALTNYDGHYNGGLTIFSGYLQPLDYGIHRTAGGGDVTYQLRIIHYLSDLVDVPTSSKALGQIDPTSLKAKVNIATTSGTSGYTTPAPAILASVGKGIEIFDDLWENYIKKIMVKLAGGEFWKGGRYDPAYAILTQGFFNPSWMNPKPLMISRRWLGRSLIKMWEEIKAQTVAAEFFSIYWNSNLWQALLSMGSKYIFDVVPTVDGIGVLPVFPMYRTAYKTLYLDEYSAVESTGVKQEVPIDGVIVFGQTAGRWTTGQHKGNKGSEALGAWPLNLSTIQGGKILYVNGPSWLGRAYPLICGSMVQSTTGLHQPLQERSMPSSIRQFAKSTFDQIYEFCRTLSGTTITDQEDNQTISYSPPTAYARAVFLNQRFATRTMTLITNLRFDIAPGTIIRLKGLGSVIGSDDSTTFYGMVSNVSYRGARTANGAELSTIIQLTHVRTAEENEEYGVDTHPIYDTQQWIGCGLVNV